MRLYLVHPSYLDAKGLVGLWRESLLAQRILLRLKSGECKVGYANHPSLLKFKLLPKDLWLDSIGDYLFYILKESKLRNYNFNESLILSESLFGQKVKISESELDQEVNVLKSKLSDRDHNLYLKVKDLNAHNIKLHPIFIR